MNWASTIKWVGIAGALILAAILINNHIKEFSRRGIAEQSEKDRADKFENALEQQRQFSEQQGRLLTLATNLGDIVAARQTERTIVLQGIKDNVVRVKPEDDGAVAPVLRDTIERLWALSATEAAARDRLQVPYSPDRPTPPAAVPLAGPTGNPAAERSGARSP